MANKRVYLGGGEYKWVDVPVGVDVKEEEIYLGGGSRRFALVARVNGIKIGEIKNTFFNGQVIILGGDDE